MKELCKKCLKPEIVRKITGTICALEGIFTMLMAVMIARLYLTEGRESFSPDELDLFPMLIGFCAFYGILCVFYSYFRFRFASGTPLVELFWKYKITVILFIVVSGMSLVWVLPTMLGRTDLMGYIEVPIGIIGMLAIVLDFYLYIRVFVKWMRS